MIWLLHKASFITILRCNEFFLSVVAVYSSQIASNSDIVLIRRSLVFSVFTLLVIVIELNECRFIWKRCGSASCDDVWGSSAASGCKPQSFMWKTWTVWRPKPLSWTTKYMSVCPVCPFPLFSFFPLHVLFSYCCLFSLSFLNFLFLFLFIFLLFFFQTLNLFSNTFFLSHFLFLFFSLFFFYLSPFFLIFFSLFLSLFYSFLYLSPSFSFFLSFFSVLSPLFIPQAKMPFDANKLYCSEILAILLQNNDSKFFSVKALLCFWTSQNYYSLLLFSLCWCILCQHPFIVSFPSFLFPLITCSHYHSSYFFLPSL